MLSDINEKTNSSNMDSGKCDMTLRVCFQPLIYHVLDWCIWKQPYVFSVENRGSNWTSVPNINLAHQRHRSACSLG